MSKKADFVNLSHRKYQFVQNELCDQYCDYRYEHYNSQVIYSQISRKVACKHHIHSIECNGKYSNPTVERLNQVLRMDQFYFKNIKCIRVQYIHKYVRFV